MSWH